MITRRQFTASMPWLAAAPLSLLAQAGITLTALPSTNQ